jgi:hypothetical protein
MRGAILPNGFSRLPPEVFCHFHYIIGVTSKPVKALEGKALAINNVRSCGSTEGILGQCVLANEDSALERHQSRGRQHWVGLMRYLPGQTTLSGFRGAFTRVRSCANTKHSPGEHDEQWNQGQD